MKIRMKILASIISLLILILPYSINALAEQKVIDSAGGTAINGSVSNRAMKENFESVDVHELIEQQNAAQQQRIDDLEARLQTLEQRFVH